MGSRNENGNVYFSQLVVTPDLLSHVTRNVQAKKPALIGISWGKHMKLDFCGIATCSLCSLPPKACCTRVISVPSSSSSITIVVTKNL